ncbi:MAG: ATP-binding cassette domain-containing protein, partial [Lachnospira sp.]
MISIRNLEKAYENVTPLKDVNAEINKGDVISIIGPSGTGKSTLLRCINLLEKPTSGVIEVDGVNLMDKNTDLRKMRQRIGMVF